MSNQIEQKLINWGSIRRESLVSADTVYLSALSELAQAALGESMCASYKPHSSLPWKEPVPHFRNHFSSILEEIVCKWASPWCQMLWDLKLLSRWGLINPKVALKLLSKSFEGVLDQAPNASWCVATAQLTNDALKLSYLLLRVNPPKINNSCSLKLLFWWWTAGKQDPTFWNHPFFSPFWNKIFYYYTSW